MKTASMERPLPNDDDLLHPDTGVGHISAQVSLQDKELLTDTYSVWIRDALGDLPVRETRATCSSCAMCAPSPTHTKNFNSDTKCCTYVPFLPNYLVGLILDDARVSALGKATIEERIRHDIGVLPMGLEQPPLYQLSYNSLQGEGCFGRAPALRCPHYLAEQGGICGIWRHRNAVCSTWFCKHNRGAVGKQFWRSIEAMLVEAEHCLSLWACQELDLGNEALAGLRSYRQTSTSKRLATEVVGEWPSLTGKLWAKWSERKQEFYIRSGKLVSPLRWSEVRKICGERLRGLESSAESAMRGLQEQRVPTQVVTGRMELNGTTTGEVIATSYSPFDAVVLSEEAFATLYTARVPKSTNSMIADGTPAETIRRMIDWGFLIGTETNPNDVPTSGSASPAQALNALLP